MSSTGVVIDHHLLGVLSLFGVLLGVLGSLYLTYELLGRSNGPLRWIIRVATPILISIAILGPAGMLEYLCFYHDHPERIVRGGILFALIGVLIGAFNGIFVDSPSSPRTKSTFSIRDSIVGLIIAFWIWSAADYVFHANVAQAFKEGAILSLTGAISGSLWAAINRPPIPTSDTPKLFSWRGFLIGFASTSIFSFISGFLFDMAFGISLEASLFGALRAAALIALAGGITGGLTRYVYWKIEKLPATTLGGFGVLLTLIGFVAQLAQPIVETFDISVK